MDAVPEFDYFTWVPLTGELQGVSVRSDGPTPGSEYDHEGASEFTIIFKSDGSTYDLNAFDFEILVDSKAVPIESQSYIWDEWGSMTSEPAPEPLTDNASVFAIADMKDGTTTQVRVYYDGKPLAVFGPNGQPTEGGCTAC